MKNKDKDKIKSDSEIWNNYIKNPQDVFDKEVTNIKTQSIKKYKFDFHGYSLEEANKKVDEIILTCVKKNFREILLITGKGIHSNSDSDVYASKNFSKLRFSIPDYIKTNPEINKYVSSISIAEIEDGGEGALKVKLKKL